jgi:hypothetical protein
VRFFLAGGVIPAAIRILSLFDGFSSSTLV